MHSQEQYDFDFMGSDRLRPQLVAVQSCLGHFAVPKAAQHVQQRPAEVAR